MTRRCQKPESHHKGVGQSPQGPELQHQGAREFFTRDWDLQQQMPSLRRQEWGHRDQRLRWYHHELQLHDGAESHVLRLVNGLITSDEDRCLHPYGRANGAQRCYCSSSKYVEC